MFSYLSALILDFSFTKGKNLAIPNISGGTEIFW